MGAEGLPGGQPGGLAADPPPGLIVAADLFFEQDADDLGGVYWSRTRLLGLAWAFMLPAGIR